MAVRRHLGRSLSWPKDAALKKQICCLTSSFCWWRPTESRACRVQGRRLQRRRQRGHRTLWQCLTTSGSRSDTLRRPPGGPGIEARWRRRRSRRRWRGRRDGGARGRWSCGAARAGRRRRGDGTRICVAAECCSGRLCRKELSPSLIWMRSTKLMERIETTAPWCWKFRVKEI